MARFLHRLPAVKQSQVVITFFCERRGGGVFRNRAVVRHAPAQNRKIRLALIRRPGGGVAVFENVKNRKNQAGGLDGAGLAAGDVLGEDTRVAGIAGGNTRLPIVKASAPT